MIRVFSILYIYYVCVCDAAVSREIMVYLFHCFIFVLVAQCLLYCMFSFPTGDEKVDHVNTKCIFHMHECWMSTWYSWCMHGTGFLYNGWTLKHVPKQECSQLSGYVLIGL